MESLTSSSHVASVNAPVNHPAALRRFSLLLTSVAFTTEPQTRRVCMGIYSSTFTAKYEVRGPIVQYKPQKTVIKDGFNYNNIKRWTSNSLVQSEGESVYLMQRIIGVSNKLGFSVKATINNSLGRRLAISKNGRARSGTTTPSSGASSISRSPMRRSCPGSCGTG
ncbi:hypothetical protein PV08_07044 [Exophiala spinifera]|uniref:Uncharacterized protein n=1 Tax=Exophiala spinifera TaxID=91928 RepID=A0A0D1ZN36_9EURO|nr:uncharacterized protein PV08_07044 [Exophiala spinifera]KIW14262.1 hypothetical protein PV08_07044 [Exophiala spinifera]